MVDLIGVIVFLVVIGILTETYNRYYWRQGWWGYRAIGKRSMDLTPQLEQGKELMEKTCLEDPIPTQSAEFCKKWKANGGQFIPVQAQNSFGTPAGLPLIN